MNNIFDANPEIRESVMGPRHIIHNFGHLPLVIAETGAIVDAPLSMVRSESFGFYLELGPYVIAHPDVLALAERLGTYLETSAWDTSPGCSGA
jgi:hypothetical protein